MMSWRYRSVIVPVTIRINQRNSPVIIVTVIYPAVSDVILDDTFFIYILIDRPDGNCTTNIEVIEFRCHIFLVPIKGLKDIITEDRTCHGTVPDILKCFTVGIPVMVIEVFPIATIVPVTSDTYRAKAFISGQGINAPISPVVVHETKVRISLSDQ
jgi:hypothetical protein